MDSRRLVIGLVLGWSGLTAYGQRAPGGELPDLIDINPQAFLQEYCLKCHGEEKQKGDRRFDHLGLDFTDDDTAFEWQEILDLINLGDMPPEDEPQPSDEERNGIVAWITPQLDQYYARLSERESTGLRRMNRFQYRNTLQDLLGLNMESFDPTKSFPSEEKFEGFENIASKLVTSRYHMERYLEAATAAIDKVLDIPQSAPLLEEHFGPDDFWRNRLQFRPQQTYFLNVDGRFVEIAHGGKTKGRLYPFRFQGVPADGYYTITIRAEGVGRDHPYDPELFQMDPDEPIKLRLFANDMSVESARDENPTNREIATLALEDNHPREYRVRTWLDKGYNFGFWYANGPVDHRRTLLKVQPRYHPETVTTNFKDVFSSKPSEELENYLSDVYQGPRLRVYEASISGPDTAEWPPQNYRDLFGATQSGRVDRDPHVLIETFTQRAFRRPVLQSELQLYHAFYEQELAAGSSVLVALADTYKAILCSPHFLYIEAPPHEDFEDEVMSREELSQYTLASRLSYFLWGTMPDQELLDAAKRGVLDRPIELKYHALRLLRDSRARAFISDFTDGWLGLSGLATTMPDETKFEDYTTYNLGKSMHEETREFFGYILKGNRPIGELLDANYSFLDRKLAKHYGLDPSGLGDRHNRVEFPADSFRGGLLGHGGVLTVTANGVDTSPVVRGVWILENILGTPPSPPPPDVPALEPDIRGATSIRDQLAKHREIATCNECHRKMDPLGFALESFDAIGAFREFYVNGEGRRTSRVDTSGKLPSGEVFADVRDLKTILKDREDQFIHCLTEKITTYALGRELAFSDRPAIDEMVEELAHRGGGLQDLVEIIVTSETFRAL
ncbi:MAG: DUF1592 domain-containing protein [Synoicihabitans sp.]